MKAIIITIGDEILIGQVIDTNSAWIAEKLNEEGIKVHKIVSISDDKNEILQTLELAKNQADLVLVTGGLGPTKDDITKQCLAEFFNTSLILDEKILKQVESYFIGRGDEMPKANLGQAMVLKGGIAMPNKNGTAPGMWYEENKTIFISMPGVPYEMKALMEEDFLPMIKSYFKTPFLYKRTILTQGIGESSLMELIEDWENSLASENIKLAYLPQPGMVRLRLSSSSGVKEEIQQKVNSKIEDLKKIIPEFIWGEEKQTLEEVVGLELNHRSQTLSTAESCTGGYIAHLITSISGSSQYFFGSIVSYANEVKQNSLDVSPVAIKVHGAVSKQVVEQMAKGVKTKLNTDFSIATSGIAGPLGGTSEKPVGTVWIAVSGPKRTISEKFNFGNHRTRNIRKTALQALNMLRKEILFQNP